MGSGDRAGDRAPDLAAVVRRTREADWAGLREIRLAALADLPIAFCERYPDAAARPAADWRERAGRATFVALDRRRPGGPFVGMAGLAQDGWPGRADLVSVYVAPPWRGTGTLEALVGAVREEAARRGARVLGLFVHEANERARRAYRRCGFRPTGGWLPYPNDPDARELEMTLPLAD